MISEQQNNFSILQPKFLWQHFLSLTKIARPSGKEQAVAEYIKNWARSLSYDFKQDATGNLVVYIPATSGLENKPTIILQSHLDMVCEKNENSDYDAEQGRINVVNDGEWLKALGTTLGADNGIGVSAALALASDPEITHGPLELLFTVDEEVGLTGAKNLDGSMLKGKILLNLDSEEDDSLFIGCAGGQDLKIIFSGSQTSLPDNWRTLKINIEGLKGGHSGIDINKGRLNAIHTLIKIVDRIFPEFLIGKISGGNKRNAIPREAEIILAIPAEFFKLAVEKINNYVATLNLENSVSEGGLTVKISTIDFDNFFTKEDSLRLVDLMLNLPSGVIAMDQKISGQIETSTNFGVIVTEKNQVELFSLIRSSSAQAIAKQLDFQKQLATSASCSFEDLGSYPSWQPNISSKLLQTIKNVYFDLFKTPVGITVIHAGLECGILGERIKDLDMISFGPLIEGVHAPDERVNILSVQKFWKLLQKILLSL